MSLESIQERHARLIKIMRVASAAEKRIVEVPALPVADSDAEKASPDVAPEVVIHDEQDSEEAVDE